MYAQQKTLYAVVSKTNPGFVSYLSLSSEKKNCKERFVNSGNYVSWKFAKAAGYRCRKINVLFQPIEA